MNNSSSIQKTALIVDDAPANLDFMERLIGIAGFTVKGAGSAKAALDLVSGLSELHLAMVDMELPDMNGIQLTGELRARFPECLLIVATMHDERSLMESVFQRGGNIFIVKPHGFMELLKQLKTGELDMMKPGSYLVIDQYGPRPYTLATDTTEARAVTGAETLT